MELTPQALHDVEFREARRGGYNTRDVDDFLERVAVGVGQLQDRLREAYHRAEAAESRLGELQRQVDELQRRGPVDGPSDADETLRRTLVLAQRTADATIKEAKEEANLLLSEAREEAARIRASAESDARREAKVEIEQLAGTREALLQDVEALERHVEEQRDRIRNGLRDLQQLLDEQSALSTTSPPPLSDVTVPARYEEPSPDRHGNGQLTSNGDGSDDLGRPSGRPSPTDGSLVAALQELPRREPQPPHEPHVDPAPTEPVGLPKASPAGATGFFPDLNAAFNPPPEPPEPPRGRSALDDLGLPIDAPPPPPPPPGPPGPPGPPPGPPAPGLGHEPRHDVAGIPIEPGSRPSEWGRGVFDTEDDPSEPRFGRR